jgi:hypothetical protein
LKRVKSAGTNDRHDIATDAVATGRVVVGNRLAHVAALDLVVHRSLRKCLRLAIGIRSSGPALFAGRQTTVNAVTVGVVGDDEHAPLGLGGHTKASAQQKEADQNCPHAEYPWIGNAGRTGKVPNNVREIVKGRLIPQSAAGHRIFPVFCKVSDKTLTARTRQIIVRS